MKRILTIAFALTLVASSAFAEDYSWSISASDTDPNVNTAPVPASGPASYYLWLTCTSSFSGAASAEFKIDVVGFFWSNFTPVLGVLNFGAGQDLVLGLGGCRTADFLAGTVNVFATGGPGALCFALSDANGSNVSVDCDPVNPVTHANAYTGLQTDGSDPCSFGSCTVSVESDTWGSIKGLYR